MPSSYEVKELDRGRYQLVETTNGRRTEHVPSPGLAELTAYLRSIGVADKEIQAMYQKAGIVPGHSD